MKTFILEWNPDISNYKMEQFEDEITNLEYGDFNWSIHEHERAQSGDNFYLVKCGEDRTGIVMKGFFTSAPYKAEDWSGQGREVFYMDMRPSFAVLPAHPKGIISTEELEKRMPDFQWNGGHSGRELPKVYANILEDLWSGYEEGFSPIDFEEGQAYLNSHPIADIEDAIRIASDAHEGQKDLDGKPVILHPLTVGLAGSNDDEIICGILHDVLEDSGWTAGELRERGFSEHIIDTLMLLCHDKSIPYMDYVRNIVESGNRTALTVKLNDLHHNLSRGKAGGHLKQVEKHSAALELIESFISDKDPKDDAS